MKTSHPSVLLVAERCFLSPAERFPDNRSGILIKASDILVARQGGHELRAESLMLEGTAKQVLFLLATTVPAKMQTLNNDYTPKGSSARFCFMTQCLVLPHRPVELKGTPKGHVAQPLQCKDLVE